MSKIAPARVLFWALFGMPLVLASAIADEHPAPGSLAHFRFNGDGKSAHDGKVRFELFNVEFRDKALYLNGKYEFNAAENGYRAVCETPGLDYTNFTVAIRFKAEEFGPDKI